MKYRVIFNDVDRIAKSLSADPTLPAMSYCWIDVTITTSLRAFAEELHQEGLFVNGGWISPNCVLSVKPLL